VVANAKAKQRINLIIGDKSEVVNKKSIRDEMSCLRTSTARKVRDESDDESFKRYLPIEEANRHIRNALHQADATKEANVIGVGTTKTGHKVRFKDQESTKKARASTEWLRTLEKRKLCARGCESGPALIKINFLSVAGPSTAQHHPDEMRELSSLLWVHFTFGIASDGSLSLWWMRLPLWSFLGYLSIHIRVPYVRSLWHPPRRYNTSLNRSVMLSGVLLHE